VPDTSVQEAILRSANMTELRDRVRAMFTTDPPTDALIDQILEAAVGGDAPDLPLPPDIARARDHLAQLT
jgi:hypothetical protein